MSCAIEYSQTEQILTTSATPATAFSIDPIPGESVRLEFKVFALSHDGLSAVWYFSARIKDVDGTPTILGQLLGLVHNGDLGAALWDCYLDTNETNVLFKVKGANNKNIKWHIEGCGIGMAPPSAP